MKLFTIQPEAVIQEIHEKGYFICDPEKSEIIQEWDNFENSYKWLSTIMNSSIPKLNKEITYPIWAWHTYRGKPYKIDRRTTYYKNLTKNDYILEVEIPDTEVLLSDFDKWHYVLNNVGIPENEEDEEQFEYYLNLTGKLREDSWNRIFEIENSQYIQANFWKLNKNNIINKTKIY